MALIYRHRVNTIDELEKIPTGLGIEFDLRSEGNDLIVTHDPFTNGPKLEEFLRFVGPRPCIVNVKCEGLVESALAALDAASIRQFFFLDLPMADQVLLKRAGRTEFAIAYSEYEPAPLAMVWARKANWVWIDCWTDYPKEPDVWEQLAENFQLCLASPELHGHNTDAAQTLRSSIRNRHYDAVCSKHPNFWGFNT